MLKFKRNNQGSTDSPEYVYDCEVTGRAFRTTFSKVRIARNSNGRTWDIWLLSEGSFDLEIASMDYTTKADAIDEISYWLKRQAV